MTYYDFLRALPKSALAYFVVSQVFGRSDYPKLLTAVKKVEKLLDTPVDPKHEEMIQQYLAEVKASKSEDENLKAFTEAFGILELGEKGKKV